MKQTIRGYANANRMTLHQAFCKAWRFEYDQTPSYFVIKEDIERYTKVGAIPPYVASFLKKQKPSILSYFPYWLKV